MESDREWVRMFGVKLRETFEQLPVEFEKLQEIRLRAGQPVYLWYGNREYTMTADGGLAESGKLGQAGGRSVSPRIVGEKELRETVECMGNYSLYAFEDEIRQGFFTVRGGHRIGLAGKAVMEDGRLKTIRYISGVNVRYAHQVKGCAVPVLPRLFQEGRLCHSLVISPPRGGKTTLLRDLVRLLSTGGGGRPGMNVAVVDERSEIGACYQGVPQNDLGPRTDVLDCCPKAQGMMLLIRTMAPAAVAADEIGSREDGEAVEYAASCGCSVLATVHGSSLEEVGRKPVFRELFREGIFRRVVVLRDGKVLSVLDEDGKTAREDMPAGKEDGTWSG